MQLVWIDLETSGLRPDHDVVLEIAVSLADLSSPFDARPAYHAVLYARPAKTLDPKVLEMHTKNGLFAECACPGARSDFDRIEEELLALVPEVDDPNEKPVLAGSSVHFDHEFLKAEFPKFAARLSHRHYDVSAVKLFCRSLGMPKLPRAEAHRAKDDVLESIAHARLCAVWAGAAPRRESTPAGFVCPWCVRPFGGGVAEMSAHEKACDWRPGGPLRDERGFVRAARGGGAR